MVCSFGLFTQKPTSLPGTFLLIFQSSAQTSSRRSSPAFPREALTVFCGTVCLYICLSNKTVRSARLEYTPDTLCLLGAGTKKVPGKCLPNTHAVNKIYGFSTFHISAVASVPWKQQLLWRPWTTSEWGPFSPSPLLSFVAIESDQRGEPDMSLTYRILGYFIEHSQCHNGSKLFPVAGPTQRSKRFSPQLP